MKRFFMVFGIIWSVLSAVAAFTFATDPKARSAAKEYLYNSLNS